MMAQRLLKREKQAALTWQAGRGGTARLEVNTAGEARGEVIVSDTASCYLTLGSPPGGYQKIGQGSGLPAGVAEFHLASLVARSDDGVVATLLLLEYDAAGNRVGTVRGNAEGAIRYRPRPGVARVLVCVRLAGTGRVIIERLSWQRHTAMFERVLSRPVTQPALDYQHVNGRPLLLGHGEGSAPFTIWPHGSVRLCLFDIEPGRHVIELLHHDPVIADRHGSIEARVTLSDAAEIAEPLNVVSRTGGRYRHAATITLLDRQAWMVVDLQLGLDRMFNVERAGVVPYTGTSAAHADETLFAETVGNFLQTIRDPHEITCVIHSEVNVNVVDGSSVWLSSVLSMLTAQGRCLLVSRMDVDSDIVLSNVTNRDRLEVLSPADIRRRRPFTAAEAIHVIRRLDERLPALRNIVIRGCNVAERLFADRRFRGRGLAYLTDFYIQDETGLVVPEEKAAIVRIAAAQAKRLLVQTPAIEAALRRIAARDFAVTQLPPSIPSVALPPPHRPDQPGDGIVRIGYAGKINPRWGITQLLDWAEALVQRGLRIELTIISNKISDKSGPDQVENLRGILMRRFDALGATFIDGLNREDSMRLMNEMDFVWCWRPSELEDQTFELSTKLVEMAAQGARCICYPNTINRNLLGDDYPFFANGLDDVARIIETMAPRPVALGRAILRQFSQETIGVALADALNRPVERPHPRVLISGNGLKFVEPYASALKAAGHQVRIDHWEWGKACDLAATAQAAEWADTVLCEWGLANAVWFSHNLPEGKRLFVRCHAQEVRERARKFGLQINAERVEKFIFVSERIRRRAIELFGWPEEKTVLIPNYLLDDEFAPVTRRVDPQGIVRIGLLGMIPQSKRIDRALDLLAELGKRGIDARLHLKGHRPEQLDYMYAPGRIEELKYFLGQFERIERDPALTGKVVFDDWGNDVAEWYGGIDHILSPSDHESFHYALADGVVAGCNPLLWPWEDAERVYPAEWVVADATAAADAIATYGALPDAAREERRAANRAVMVERYGYRRIFDQLDAVLGLSTHEHPVPQRTGEQEA